MGFTSADIAAAQGTYLTAQSDPRIAPGLDLIPGTVVVWGTILLQKQSANPIGWTVVGGGGGGGGGAPIVLVDPVAPAVNDQWILHTPEGGAGTPPVVQLTVNAVSVAGGIGASTILDFRDAGHFPGNHTTLTAGIDYVPGIDVNSDAAAIAAAFQAAFLATGINWTTAVVNNIITFTCQANGPDNAIALGFNGIPVFAGGAMVWLIQSIGTAPIPEKYVWKIQGTSQVFTSNLN